MKCEWEKLLAILPPSMRADVDKLGKDRLQELRLRLGRPPSLEMGSGRRLLPESVTGEDILFVINAASRYSPWASASMSQGYLTAPGGHRIGLCGEASVRDGEVTGIRTPTSLCIRVARDFPGIAAPAAACSGNILIVGAPSCGKTTLLRDLVRQISEIDKGSIAVMDERGELFPPLSGFDPGPRTDVLTGCGKVKGLEIVLRTMGPACIAVDEVTSEEDCRALESALWCGVRILATAHASGKQDLMGRNVYRKLISSGLFDWLVVMNRDKSWKAERM